jgi:hypothetical protein
MTAKKKATSKKKTAKKKVAKKKATKKKAVKKKSPLKKEPCRQTKWNDSYLPVIENLFRGGRTVLDVCLAFRISERTFYNWKNEYFSEETLQSMEDWKKDADREVMSSLYRNAKGSIETVTKDIYDEDGNVIGTEVSTVEIKGDVRAQQYWLNNRQRDKWSDKPEPVEGEGGGKKTIGFNFKEEADPI